MLRKITLGNRTYAFGVGDKGFVVSNDEFIHNIYPLDGTVELNVGKAFKPEFKPFTLAELQAAEAFPLSLFEWGHYWGIKPRMAGNYALLLKSMREIGISTKSMPKWGDDDRAAV